MPTDTTTTEFRAEAERAIDTLQMPGLRREDGVALLLALFQWAASHGALRACGLMERSGPTAREHQLDHDEEKSGAYR